MDTSEDKKGEPSKSGLTITDATIRNVENIPKAVDVEAIVNESNLSQIRNSVNENSIQLWKEPYFDKDKKVPNENKLLELACNLSTTLELDDMYILRGLMNLQQNALDKLEAREKLASTNTIALKIKLSSTITATKKSFKLDIDMYSSG